MKKRKNSARETRHAPFLSRETIEIADRHELLIGGVCGIAEYSTGFVLIQTKSGDVRILGSALSLCWAGDGRLLLCGRIEVVQFFNEKKGGKRNGKIF